MAEQLAGVRLRLGLPEAGGRKRTSVIRLVPEDAAVRVEHFVVREGPPLALRALAEPPEVVAMLLERFAVDPGPDPSLPSQSVVARTEGPHPS